MSVITNRTRRVTKSLIATSNFLRRLATPREYSLRRSQIYVLELGRRIGTLTIHGRSRRDREKTRNSEMIREQPSNIERPMEYGATMAVAIKPASHGDVLQSSLSGKSTIGRSALLRRECV